MFSGIRVIPGSAWFAVTSSSPTTWCTTLPSFVIDLLLASLSPATCYSYAATLADLKHLLQGSSIFNPVLTLQVLHFIALLYGRGFQCCLYILNSSLSFWHHLSRYSKPLNHFIKTTFPAVQDPSFSRCFEHLQMLQEVGLSGFQVIIFHTCFLHLSESGQIFRYSILFTACRFSPHA